MHDRFRWCKITWNCVSTEANRCISPTCTGHCSSLAPIKEICGPSYIDCTVSKCHFSSLPGVITCGGFARMTWSIHIAVLMLSPGAMLCATQCCDGWPPTTQGLYRELLVHLLLDGACERHKRVSASPHTSPPDTPCGGCSASYRHVSHPVARPGSSITCAAPLAQSSTPAAGLGLQHVGGRMKAICRAFLGRSLLNWRVLESRHLGGRRLCWTGAQAMWSGL